MRGPECVSREIRNVRGETVFVYAAQSLDWTRENTCRYGGTVSGPTIYAYANGNPLVKTDPYGLAPGDPYPSQVAAARQATNDVIVQSIYQNREFGGMIYRNPNGTYSYTTPIDGGATRSTPGDQNHVQREPPPRLITIRMVHMTGLTTAKIFRQTILPTRTTTA